MRIRWNRRLSCTLLTLLAFAILPLRAETRGVDANPGASSLPNEEAWQEAWETGPDRETLVRFARAWGLVSSVLQADAPDTGPLDDAVAKPEALADDVSRQVQRHIGNNGLDQEQWARLMARMERDPNFRTRVEMLAAPYQTPIN